MSEPLSVAAGVIGILTAAAQITTLLTQLVKTSRKASKQARHVITEISNTRGIVSQLQSLLVGNEYKNTSRLSLLKVDHVNVIVSSCVLTFSELENLLDGMKTRDMSMIDSMKWARRENEIMFIVQRIQHHKASLSLILDIMHQCVHAVECDYMILIFLGILLQTLKFRWIASMICWINIIRKSLQDSIPLSSRNCSE